MTERILVVDDEPTIQRTLRINLRARGYEVETVGTGRDALMAVAETEPDLVILDLGLPTSTVWRCCVACGAQAGSRSSSVGTAQSDDKVGRSTTVPTTM